jgi:hypothetical protein
MENPARWDKADGATFGWMHVRRGAPNHTPK